MTGLEGRLGLLIRLGSALEEQERFFGGAVSRPGNLLGEFCLRRSVVVELTTFEIIFIDNMDHKYPLKPFGMSSLMA